MKFSKLLVKIILITISVASICFLFICFGWTIYACVKYGNTPISEIPAWALWFMFKWR